MKPVVPAVLGGNLGAFFDKQRLRPLSSRLRPRERRSFPLCFFSQSVLPLTD